MSVNSKPFGSLVISGNEARAFTKAIRSKEPKMTALELQKILTDAQQEIAALRHELKRTRDMHDKAVSQRDMLLLQLRKYKEAFTAFNNFSSIVSSMD